MAELTPITSSPIVHGVRKIEPEHRQKQRRENQQPDEPDASEKTQQNDQPVQHIDEIV